VNDWRLAHVVEQRARGRTFAAIAEDLHVTRARVHQMFWEHANRERRAQQAAVAKAEQELTWRARQIRWAAIRGRTDELLTALIWFRYGGGAEAFEAFAEEQPQVWL